MTQYVVRPMQYEDIDAVGEVERECFSTPWPSSAYRRELRDNRMGRYIVLAEVVEDERSPGRSHQEPVPGEPVGGVRRAVGQFLRPFGRPVPAPTAITKERVVGFAGMWLMLDEAHVTTIGVKRDLRGLGLGELLFATLLEIAMNMGARRATLEVRASNYSAQALYRKYGFHEEGTRRRYYSDNNEDALIMWSDWLGAPEIQARYRETRTQLDERLGDLIQVRL
ncbi:MAG TPA: ribosomal protein S18-alanine N-acetyltransferase [Chloroflexota bacterium]|nr:ribosomal protein S18-alanine N-acetyltransferase [Chloroflexota bacterium]